MRTCVACRTVAPRPDLLRFVRAPDGGVAFDVRARLPGSGAYTCPLRACLSRASEKGGFARAFEAPVLDTGKVLEAKVEAALCGEVLSGLGLARRAGQLVAGRDEVLRRLETAPVEALVLAADLSDRSRAELTGRLPDDARVLRGPAKEAMGGALGRKPTGVVALLAGPLATRVVADLIRWSRFDGIAPSTTSGRLAACEFTA